MSSGHSLIALITTGPTASSTSSTASKLAQGNAGVLPMPDGSEPVKPSSLHARTNPAGIAVIWVLSGLSLAAQVALPSAGGPDPTKPPEFAVVGRSANCRIYERTEYEPSPYGQLRSKVHRVIELGSSICYQLPAGEWADSDPAFELTPEGYAVALRGPSKISIAPNLTDPDGVLQIQSPDGHRFRSAPIGIVLYSPATGKSLQVGRAQDCQAWQTASNEITFSDAFEGLKASLRFRNENGSFHQEVLLSRKLTPKLLERLGFSSDLAREPLRIETWSEFLEAPEPAVQTILLKTETDPARRAAMVEPDTTDAFLDFGDTKFARGIAFSDTDPENSVTVFKRWLEDPQTGRRFLVEACDYAELLPLLDSLPEATFAGISPSGNPKTLMAQTPRPSSTLNSPSSVLLTRALPERAPHSAGRPPLLIAKLDPSRPPPAGPQVTIDYVGRTGFITNQLFLSDQTYVISNSVNLYGSNVLLGGTILKFNANASITLPSGSLVSLAPAFQQAVVTCVDDNSYGEVLGTGNPSGYYANPALSFQSLGCVSLPNLRFAYAKQAIAASSTTLDLPHAQFIKCQQGVSLSGGRLNLRNALFANCITNFNIQSPTTIDAQNVTFSGTAYLATAAGSGSTVTLTNCILANVTNLNTGYPALSGDCNGFYNSPTFGTTIYTASSYPFCTVGGASYYFAEDSPFRSSASTNINATLQADLRQRTVWPPIVFSNATISADTTFSPQALRDSINSSLGYHYWPLDYVFGGATGNANLTFNPGTSVGWFHATSGWQHAGHGIHMADTKTIAFNGTPTAPCYWIRCSTVQEGGNGLWQGGYGAGGISGWAATSALAPKIRATWLRAAQLANDSTHFRDDYGYLSLRAAHSEFLSGGIGGYATSVYLTNSLLDRVEVWLEGGQSDIVWDVRDCTVIGSYFRINRWYQPTPVTIRDSSFDNVNVTTADQYNANANVTSYSYNAFITNCARTTPTGANDVLVTNFNWQTGPLGNYYLLSGSPLINAGSTTANLLGLYHFTVCTNLLNGLQIKETNSVVDIGFHRLATDSAGNPIDSDGDGICDALEDLNGNGIATDDPTSWTNYNSPNGLSSEKKFEIFTPLK